MIRQGRSGLWGRAGFVSTLAIALITPGALAQSYSPPRLADGHPDLQGIWDSRILTPLERPAGVDRLVVPRDEAARIAADMLKRRDNPNELDPSIAVPDATSLAKVMGEYRTSMIVEPTDGKLPLTPEGAKMRTALAQPLGVDDPEQRPLVERCIVGPGQAPFAITAGGMYRQIIETPNAVAIHTESQDDTRIVRLDARHAPVSSNAPLGDSIGRWEGDTLVVETSHARMAAAGGVLVRSSSLVIERFTRVGPDELLYQFSVEDPAIYSAPWRAEFSLTHSDVRLYEWSCHEANYSLANVLRAGRAAARAALPPAQVSSRKRSSGPARRP